jgi:hypothetical protein
MILLSRAQRADSVEKLVGFGVLKRAIALIYFGRP